MGELRLRRAWVEVRGSGEAEIWLAASSISVTHRPEVSLLVRPRVQEESFGRKRGLEYPPLIPIGKS